MDGASLMTDKRAYFKLDVGYLTNPKVADVALESPTAVLLHVGSIGYAAQHLTDGEVPVSLLLRLTGATKKDAETLFAAGLWERHTDSGKARIHDYLSHQRSSTEAKGASEAAKRAAQARWDAESNADGNAIRMPDAMPDAKQSASEVAMPREKEREKREKTLSDTSDVDVDFLGWYAVYPRKEAKGAAVKAYRAARKKTDAATLLAAIQRHAPRMLAGDRKFIPLPASWLNSERWLDEVRDSSATVADPTQLPPRETSWMERRR